MELLMRQHRWENTPVGPVEQWPLSLKATVRLLLDCQLPAYLAWGDRYTQFYNDAYTPILGAKHPAALGSDARVSWSEVWPTIGPMWQAVRQGQPIGAEDLKLDINRYGYFESCYFTVSYSPVYDDDGQVAGVLVTFVHTTKMVQRQAFQIRLADILRSETDAAPLLNAAMRLASEYFHGARLAYADVDSQSREAFIREAWQDGAGIEPARPTLPLDVVCLGHTAALERGDTVCIDDVGTDPALSIAAAVVYDGARAGIAVPLIDAGRLLAVAFMHSDTPRDWSEDERTLAEDFAHRTWDAVRRIRAEQALLDETRLLELLNKTGATLASMLELDTLLQSITDAATQLTGAQFGAFFYNGTDTNGDAYSLYTLSGAPRSAFESFGHPRPTPIFSPTFFGGPPVRSDDITKDPRYGKMAPHHGMPPGHLPVCSYLAASVVSRSGEVLGGLFFGHSERAMFDARTERIIVSFAAQAAIAIDNARLYEIAQRAANEREALLASERAARAEAERHNKMKDEFLAMLAHELRNPLAPITNAAQLLKLQHTDEALRLKASQIIGRQVRHMTELVDDLLDVSRVTRGLIKLETELLDLRAVAAAAVEQARPHIEGRQHTLAIKMPDVVVPIAGDRTRLVQVLVNLLNNAAKYTPQGGHIALTLDVDHAGARVTVRDNGSGIDPQLLPHVFDLFTQAERAPDRSQGGLGIGLALVKSLVLMHNGRVDAHSDGANLGTAVTVSLPLADPAHAGAQGGAVGPKPACRPLTITVVDDNVDAAQSLAMLLRAQGHVVHVYEDGATTLASEYLPQTQAFVLDIGLPDMTGYELARRLRRNPANAQALYIALTGYGQARDHDLSRREGFSRHLVKPVDIAVLGDILAEAQARQPSDRQA
jgi:signal transduction histidine kinase/CheY-like chemotaxis protein/putative methionine-R-sulfoxide reductase with GAF domain